MDPFNPFSWNLRATTAIAVGLGVAIGLGYATGEGDFVFVGKAFSVLLFFAFVLFFQKKTWLIGLLICFTDLFYSPFDFNMGSIELTTALGGLLFVVGWWHKTKIERPPVFEGSGFSVLNLSLLTLLIYGAIHCWYNIANPFRPEDYAFKNLAKTYVLFLGPLTVAAYFMNRPRAISVTRMFPYRVAQCLAIGLALNIGLRIYQIFTAGYDVDTFTEEDMLRVPVIGAYQNIFALRELPPIAALFAFAYIGTTWHRALPLLRRWLFWGVLVGAMIGSLLSGGRATVVFVLALIAGVLAYHRRIGALMACGAAMILFVVAANVFSDKMEKLPFYVQRSTTWAIYHYEGETQGSIDDSSNWRRRLFDRAIAEWESDPRIFWFGRATYRYDVEDQIAYTLLGEEAKIDTSLRRGATHNLISDLLIVFGLVGFTIYVWVMFALAYFLWKIMRSPAASEISSRLAMVCLVFHSFTFVYGLFGGSDFSPALTWLLIMLTTSLYQFQVKGAEEKSPSILPPRAVRGRPMIPAGVAAR